MKKIIFLTILLLSIGSKSNGNEQINNFHRPLSKIDTASGNIVLINDTSNAIKVHTGSGEVTLNPKGGKTSFSCNPGKQVKFDGKVAFKVTEDMCGTTIKVSTYM